MNPELEIMERRLEERGEHSNLLLREIERLNGVVE